MESLEEISRSLEAASHIGLAEGKAAVQGDTDKQDSSHEGTRDDIMTNHTNPSTPLPDDEDSKPEALNAPTPSALDSSPYPQLSNNSPPPPDVAGEERNSGGEDEEPNFAKSFDRSSSPNSAPRAKGTFVEKVGEDGVSRMHKFTLYETATYFYVVGADLLDRRFRILKIDRTAEPGNLSIAEDDIIYTKKETNQTLNAIDEGNRSSGGLRLKASFWGLLGFVRFTGPYYMQVVTKRSQVAMIGGHYIYQVDGTELVPLTMASSTRFRSGQNPQEIRFMGILNNLDLTRSFYFSYSYDITRTLQHNILRERKALYEGLAEPLQHDHNDMFVWNHHLLGPAKEVLNNTYDWCIPIVHGYVDQAALSVYWGRVVYITIIARRSRFFAGARYLKRGANDLGYVANDVETEQIVAEMLTTSFHAPGPSLYANPNYTSYVQHRGSIPLNWTQDSTGVSPKPDIQLNLVDPFYGAAALHFDNLFERYGAPVYVLNLVKARERTPRESKLLIEYNNAINYLNQFLPEGKKIIYDAFDMSRAAKSRDQDVIGSLETIAGKIIPVTGFFQNGNDVESGLRLQNGVARTNCIDCLDRTNAAQFVIAKKALGYQLQALGVIDEPSVEYDSDAVNLFTHMWHDHGDTIAIQYGGSHLVNTMATYRKINQWTSQSRDMVESFKRYYNNSFMDAQRQEAYNLFLGNYIFAQNEPMLWDLSTDYYLHNSNPRLWFDKKKHSYIHWYTSKYIQQRAIPPPVWPQTLADESLPFFDDYWLEYYRPLAISSFAKVFSFKMHSNLRYIPIKSTQEGRYDLSPFKVRNAHESADHQPQSKSQPQRRKGVTILAPSDHPPGDTSASIEARIIAPITVPDPTPAPKPNALGPWLDAQQQQYSPSRRYTGVIKEPSFEAPSNNPSIPPIPAGILASSSQPPTKAEQALEAFTRLVANSLNPSVPDAEEYQRYVTHPLNLPLVVSSETDLEKVPNDFLEYLGKLHDLGVAPDSSNGYGGGGFVVNGNSGTRTFSSSPGAGVGAVVPIVNGSAGGVLGINERAEMNRDEYREFLEVGDEGLTVLEEDSAKKRYQAYRKWLRGKSFFKQKHLVGIEV